MLQHFAVSKDTDITDIEKVLLKKKTKWCFFPPDLSLLINSSTHEKHSNFEKKNLQLQTIHEFYPSAIKRIFA